MITRFTAAAILTATLAAPAGAQMAGSGGMTMPAEHPCPATPAALPPELAGWTSSVPLTAATNPRELSIATLQPGRGARATLAPSDRLSFPLAPAHAPAAGSYSGLFALAVTKAGTYRVALGAAPWVDVVKDGQAVASSAHGHGPDCSGIRKIVDFALAPGRYVIQVSGATAPALTLMVVPPAG